MFVYLTPRLENLKRLKESLRDSSFRSSIQARRDCLARIVPLLNLTNAIHYYELAADNPHDAGRSISAQKSLDYIYSYDAKNNVEAAKWCRKAAAGGDKVAQYNLWAFVIISICGKMISLQTILCKEISPPPFRFPIPK